MDSTEAARPDNKKVPSALIGKVVAHWTVKDVADLWLSSIGYGQYNAAFTHVLHFAVIVKCAALIMKRLIILVNILGQNRWTSAASTRTFIFYVFQSRFTYSLFAQCLFFFYI